MHGWQSVGKQCLLTQTAKHHPRHRVILTTVAGKVQHAAWRNAHGKSDPDVYDLQWKPGNLGYEQGASQATGLEQAKWSVTKGSPRSPREVGGI